MVLFTDCLSGIVDAVSRKMGVLLFIKCYLGMWGLVVSHWSQQGFPWDREENVGPGCGAQWVGEETAMFTGPPRQTGAKGTSLCKHLIVSP